MFYLVNTKRPLEEKTAPFLAPCVCHRQFEGHNYDQLLEQINIFRERGLGNYRDLLLEMARNPTMIFWLDNQQNHGTAVTRIGVATARAIQPRRRQLHRDGRSRMFARLHRLDLRDQDPACTLWSIPWKFEVSPGRPR